MVVVRPESMIVLVGGQLLHLEVLRRSSCSTTVEHSTIVKVMFQFRDDYFKKRSVGDVAGEHPRPGSGSMQLN